MNERFRGEILNKTVGKVLPRVLPNIHTEERKKDILRQSGFLLRLLPIGLVQYHWLPVLLLKAYLAPQWGSPTEKIHRKRMINIRFLLAIISRLSGNTNTRF